MRWFLNSLHYLQGDGEGGKRLSSSVPSLDVALSTSNGVGSIFGEIVSCRSGLERVCDFMFAESWFNKVSLCVQKNYLRMQLSIIA